MRIVLDSNALFDDPVMVRTVSKKVLALLVPARATLVFSPIVLRELDRQRRDGVEGLQAPSVAALRSSQPSPALTRAHC
ncbi:MAG: hypothetical protein JWN91_1162 [Nocardioides sp.]|nr:hypothetical protein [Nocardioides sp.]